MNNIIFVDTSGFMEAVQSESENFERINSLFRDTFLNGNRLITTDYVLDELFTLMRCRERLPVSELTKFVKNTNVSDIEIVGITKDLFQEALTMMGKYGDQYFSFTDCVSFAVMKELKIKNVITFDKHFSIAGFNNLLAAKA